MKRAFVGIAQRDGLLTLLPERPEVTPFLLKRAERMRAVCFWAVIDQSIADAITAELDAGGSHNALILLQTLAIELGPVMAIDTTHENRDSETSPIIVRRA